MSLTTHFFLFAIEYRETQIRYFWYRPNQHYFYSFQNDICNGYGWVVGFSDLRLHSIQSVDGAIARALKRARNQAKRKRA